MAENLTFPIPKELLEPFIQQAVSTSIISALGDGKELINRAVYETVKMKVDKHGEVSKYSSDNKYTLLDILAKNEIKRIVIDTVKISVEELRPQIIEGVKRALNENAEDLGSALVDRYLKDIYRSLGIAVTKPHAGYGKMTMTSTHHSKVRVWYETKKRPPLMEDFAREEDIAEEKARGTVIGLSVPVEIAYIDTPEGLFRTAELYIPFEGKIKWYMSYAGDPIKEVGEPKYWRKKK